MSAAGPPDAAGDDPLARVEARFVEAWPSAVAVFSPYTRLLPPVYCRTEDDEKREGLQGSFAMIRMRDDRIVISVRQVAQLGIEAHARAVLAHEVGHYVHAPGSLLEHVRLHDRIARTLPDAVRSYAGVVANLYTDLLLNDRLQRSAGVDVAAVYAALRKDDVGELWGLYTRTYERLWRLGSGTLAPRSVAPEVDADAELAARIVRLFRTRWMDGAASFALLVAPYLERSAKDAPLVPAWLDTAATSVGDQIPGGLLDDDFDPNGTPHPAMDGRLGDLVDEDEGDGEDGRGKTERSGGAGPDGRATRGDGRPDRRTVKRGPREYLDLLRAVGVTRSPKELVARYYRELAMPHVVPFPAERVPRAVDPLPEGLDPWELGSPIEQIDWLATVVKSPVVIPGVTTVERAWGVAEGGEPELRPPDLYIGIDCSGSMGNPAYSVQYPIVAGVVMALSALRAGARVMACLSGEWHGQGSYVETKGFVRDEAAILAVLTDYLGTGASFGLPRLATTFGDGAPRRSRPVHVLVVSDTDLFGEIDGTKDGWEIARRAVQSAGGGATAVLRLASASENKDWLAKLAAAGFASHAVTSQESMVDFARAFSRRTYARDAATKREARA